MLWRKYYYRDILLHLSLCLQPTRDDRGWLINPIGRNPWWTVLAASIPALLCTILIFMDQQITAVIINRKEHKLLVCIFFKVAFTEDVCVCLCWSCVCDQYVLYFLHTERLRVPFGSSDGWSDASRMFYNGVALVCRSNRPVNFPRQQPEAGVWKLRPWRATSISGN